MIRRPGGSSASYGVVEGAARSRWAPHEIAIVLCAFCLPYLGEAPLGLGAPQLKVAALGTALGLCIFALLWRSGHGEIRLLRPARTAALFAVIYGGAITLSTASWVVSTERWFLLLIFWATIALFAASEAIRPGAMLDVLYRASVLHLIVALVTQDRYLLDGSGRLAGGLTPVALGFEAALVIVLSLSKASTSPSSRLVRLASTLLGALVVLDASSRTAILTLAGALLLVGAYRASGSLRIIIAAASTVVIVVGGISIGVIFPESQGAGESISFTGRTEIWTKILEGNEHWMRGYGFAALRYPFSGPDAFLFELTGRLPSENALLQAVLMGGLIAGAAWLAVASIACRELLRVRVPTRGFSLAILALLATNALFSVGLSGVSTSWWWLLAASGSAAYFRLPGASGTLTARNLSLVRFKGD